MSLADRRISRRDFLRISALAGSLPEVGLIACTSNQRVVQTQAEKSKAEGKKDLSVEERIGLEVKRVAENVLTKEGTEQAEAASYYLGKPLSDLRPSYRSLPIRFAANGGFAQTRYGVQELDGSKAFFYRKNPASITETRQSLATSIYMGFEFSSMWLSDSSDQVKALMMYKEFLHLKIWPAFAPAYLQEFRSQIPIRLEGNPSKLEVEDTVLMSAIISDNPDNQTVKNLFDNSAYLLVWPWMKRLMNGSASDRRGLEFTDFPDLYKKVTDKGLDYNLKVDSPDFISTAFSPTSSWVTTSKEHMGNLVTPNPTNR